MRLKNYDVDSIQQVEDFELRPDMTIQIQALPPDYDDAVEAELPSPQPERLGLEKDDKGRIILDENNNPVIHYKEDDPEYLKASSQNGKLHAIYLMVKGLVPGQMEFEAQKDPNNPREFYKAVIGELRDFGFSMGDLLKLVRAISKLSGITQSDIQEMEKDFSEAES